MTIGEGKDSRKFSRQRDLHPSINHSLVSNSFYDRQDDIARYLARIGRRESPRFALVPQIGKKGIVRRWRTTSDMVSVPWRHVSTIGFDIGTRVHGAHEEKTNEAVYGWSVIADSRTSVVPWATKQQRARPFFFVARTSNDILGFFKKGSAFSPFKRCFLAAWKSANVQSSNTHTRHRYTYRYLSLVVYVHWE